MILIDICIIRNNIVNCSEHSFQKEYNIFFILIKEISNKVEIYYTFKGE